MKPRTKLQHRVIELSGKFFGLTNDQEKWVYKHCLDHIAYRTKKNVSCLDCGNIWDGPQKGKTCKCPECGEKLLIETTRKKKLTQGRTIVSLFDVVDEFQVVRFFELFSYHKSGEKPKQYIWEIVQQWIVPNEKLTIVARTNMFYNSAWSGDLEIRTNVSNYYTSNKYDVVSYKILPDSKFLPIYQRNGFTAKLENIAPYSFLQRLLTSTRLETLIKAGQYRLASDSTEDKIYRYWNSIKICIRKKYNITSPKTWLDYLELLEYFGRDLRNPKYICAKNLDKEHNRLVAKKAEILRRQREQRDLERAIKDKQTLEAAAIAYKENKAAFFGLVFTDGNISIKVLESVDEFIKESDALKHCVFTNKYYDKPDSLILSARIDDKPIETIELSLSRMKIEQSRGIHNQATEYNKQIIDLLKKNIPAIKKKYKELKTAAA